MNLFIICKLLLCVLLWEWPHYAICPDTSAQTFLSSLLWTLLSGPLHGLLHSPHYFVNKVNCFQGDPEKESMDEWILML